VCAVIRPAGAPDGLDLDTIRAALGDVGLARQKWPEQVLLIDELPRTPSGKVQKAVLRTRLREQADQKADQQAGQPA
jgi:cyclohexanecarboxylate-CoA ligase